MAGKSEEVAAAALTTVLRDHGWDAASNAKRLRGGLSDVLGAETDEHRGLVDALVLAVEEGVVHDLREVGREGVGTVLPGLVSRLAEWGLTGERATWAVLTWAALLPDATLPPPVMTAEPPDTRPEPLAPTTLPPMVTAPAPIPAMAPGVTIAPVSPIRRENGRGGAPAGRRSRRTAVLVAVAAAVVLSAGGVAAAMNWSGEEPEPDRPPAGSGSTGASETPDEPPAQAKAGTVIAAATTTVPTAEEGLAMGAAAGGVRIARLGEVETVGSGADELSAPEGGRLLAFKLTNGPCERETCRPWSQLGLRVAVGDDVRRLPAASGADTFVVAVPADVTDVELVLKADKLTQSLSLMTGEPGPGNVEVLARTGRVDRIGDRFTMTERTSEDLDYGSIVTDTVPRDVRVIRAELSFFTQHGRPSSPTMAFLRLRAEYTIPYGSSTGPFAFDLQEVRFVARDGVTYQARDIDEGPGLNAVFEVPADLRGGTFVLGGGTYSAIAGDGSTITRTLAERKVKVSFG